MNNLIANATSTFNSTMGFQLTDVVDKGVEFLKLAIGTFLGYFTEALPVFLAVAVVYAVYRLAKLGWARYGG